MDNNKHNQISSDTFVKITQFQNYLHSCFSLNMNYEIILLGAAKASHIFKHNICFILAVHIKYIYSR